MRMPASTQLFAAGSMTFSLSAASATETLTVEQGWNPALSASFWLTMEKHAPGRRVHRHHRTVVGAQGIHGRPADGQILAIHVVATRSNRQKSARSKDRPQLPALPEAGVRPAGGSP